MGPRAGRARGLAAPRPRRQGGPRRRDAAAPAAHLVAAYAVGAGRPRPAPGRRQDQRAQGRPGFLGVLPCRAVVTGDAKFTHRDVCAAAAEGGGDYLLTAKENQPTLLADIKAAFAEPRPAFPSRPAAGPRASDQAAVDKGHGRREKR
ncbi:MAG: hypothetical protein U0835_04460 [Isosphaeraceae bacterium]